MRRAIRHDFGRPSCKERERHARELGRLRQAGCNSTRQDLPKVLAMRPSQVADRTEADMQQAVKVPSWPFTIQPRGTVQCWTCGTTIGCLIRVTLH